MTEHLNTQYTRSILAAAATGDIETYGRTLSNDVIYHIPGDSLIAGQYRGKEGVFRFLGTVAQETGNTLKFEVLDVMASGERSAAMGRLTAERADKRLDIGVLEVRRFDADGLVTELRMYPESTVALDGFFS